MAAAAKGWVAAIMVPALVRSNLQGVRREILSPPAALISE